MTGKDLLSIFEIEDLAGEPSVEGILRIIAGAGEVIGMLEGGRSKWLPLDSGGGLCS